ncbi:MAG: pirin family protein [Bdellovibrionales bacterium]
MKVLRKSKERGHVDHGWLRAKHTFSFSSYMDPNFMGYRSLRVINEDEIEGGEGFPTHGHENMEIITYIFDGALEHKDSMGNGSVIRPGEIQYMSAGKGVRHSEFNHLKDQSTRLLQIWIVPNQRGGEPRYGQKNVPREEKLNQLKLIISGDEKDKDAIHIYQEAKLFASVLEGGKSLEYNLRDEHGVWIQMISGELEVNGELLSQGDGLAIEKESLLKIIASKESEFLLFDLA